MAQNHLWMAYVPTIPEKVGVPIRKYASHKCRKRVEASFQPEPRCAERRHFRAPAGRILGLIKILTMAPLKLAAVPRQTSPLCK